MGDESGISQGSGVQRGPVRLATEDGATVCTPVQDIEVSNATLTDDGDGNCSISNAASTSDITDVGNCATGATFTGTCGTILTFDDADGDQTLSYDTTDNDFVVSDDLDVEDGTPHVRRTDTTASQDDFEDYADNNVWYFTKLAGVTGATEYLRFDSNMQQTVFSNVTQTVFTSVSSVSIDAPLTLANQNELRLAGLNDANYLALRAPASVTSNQTCTFEDDANFIPDSCVGDGSDSVGVTDATYVTLSTNATLTDERVLTEGTALDLVDAGAGSTVTINFDSTEVGNTTWGSASKITWIFNAGATDPNIVFDSNLVQIDTGEVRIGNAGTINTTDGDGDLYVEDELEVDGNVTITSSNTTTDVATLTAASLTTGTALTLTGPSGGTAGMTDALLKLSGDIGNMGTTNGLVNITGTVDSGGLAPVSPVLYLKLDNQSTGSLHSAYGILVDVVDASTTGSLDRGIYAQVTHTGNSNKGIRGFESSISSTSTTANIITGGIAQASHTGAISSGNKQVIGLNGFANSSGAADTGGTIDTIGLLFTATGGTGGTSTATGIDITASGADTNYAIVTRGGQTLIGDTGTVNFTDGNGDLYVQDELEVDGNTHLADLDQHNATPHHVFRDTDDNTAFMWHLDTSNVDTFSNGLTLWRGTDTGGAFSVSSQNPRMFFNTSDVVSLYGPLAIYDEVDDSGSSLLVKAPVGMAANDDMIAFKDPSGNNIFTMEKDGDMGWAGTTPGTSIVSVDTSGAKRGALSFIYRATGGTVSANINTDLTLQVDQTNAFSILSAFELGVDGAGTNNLYAMKSGIGATGTLILTQGVQNIYGFAVDDDQGLASGSSTGGTVNKYGLYIDEFANMAGSITTNLYGIFSEEAIVIEDDDGLYFEGVAGSALEDTFLVYDSADTDLEITVDNVQVFDLDDDEIYIAVDLVSTGTVPTVGTCGTSPSITSTSTDISGKVTVGTSAADTCTVTFATAKTNAPPCTVIGEDSAINLAATTTTTTLVITAPAATDFSSDVLMYVCIGNE